MSRWFRFYADAMRNPKVMRLSDKDFRLWVRLLAVASENEGHIPPLDDLRLVLNMRLDHLSSSLDGLIRGGLIDALADGYEPHNWSKFQYKSDTSKDRVAKHRRSRNVTVTPPDTDTEQSIPLDKSNGAAAVQIDPTKVMFDAGKALLIAGGVKPAQAGSLLGKWRKDHGEEALLSALGKAQREGAIEPVAFITGCFRARSRDGPSNPLMLGMNVPC